MKTKTFVENALCSIKRIARKGERERAAFFQGGVHDVMTKRIFSQRTGNDAGSTIKSLSRSKTFNVRIIQQNIFEF